MASDESIPMTFEFHSPLQGSNFENNNNDDDHHHHHDDPHPHSLSRLSVCTNSTLCGVDDEEDDNDVDEGIARYVSGLSIESFEGDADGELSEGREVPVPVSDSENENELSSCCYPLPATPPPRRRNPTPPMAVKEYVNVSDNEGKKTEQERKENDTWRRKCRRMRKEREKNRSKKKEEVEDESKGKGGTGRRSLCMDLEEVKGCRDLGFDLELEIPSRLSVSLSNSAIEIETSSGATSPISNWRISSPGDDPRDVKARLKMWAQAVAASASKYGST